MSLNLCDDVTKVVFFFLPGIPIKSIHGVSTIEDAFGQGAPGYREA